MKCIVRTQADAALRTIHLKVRSTCWRQDEATRRPLSSSFSEKGSHTHASPDDTKTHLELERRRTKRNRPRRTRALRQVSQSVGAASGEASEVAASSRSACDRHLI